MILFVLLPKILMYVKPLLDNTQLKLHPSAILIYFIMISLAFSTYFIKSNADSVPSLKKVKSPIKSYSLMPVVFVMFALNDVIAPAALQQMVGLAISQLQNWYFFGIIAGIAVILLLQTHFSMNLLHAESSCFWRLFRQISFKPVSGSGACVALCLVLPIP